MIGVLNLKETVRTESFKPYIEEDSNELFLHLERVNSLKDKLKNFTLSSDELRLVEYSLNKLPYSPTGYRFEALQSQQTNLLYRAEGIIGDIWEKIKAFFRWILEKIKSLFGMSGGSSDVPSEKEAKEVEQKVKASGVTKRFKESSLNTEEIDKTLDEANNTLDQIKSGKLPGDKANRFSVELFAAIDKATGSATGTWKEAVEKKRKENEEVRKKKEEEEDKAWAKENKEWLEKKQKEKEAEKAIRESISTLKGLKQNFKKIEGKAQALISQTEKILPSKLSVKNFNKSLGSSFSFSYIGLGILHSATDSLVSKTDLVDFVESLNFGLMGRSNNSFASELTGEAQDHHTYVSIYGLDYTVFKLTNDLKLIKTHKKIDSDNNSGKEINYDRIFELIESDSLSEVLKTIKSSKSLREEREKKLNDSIEGIYKLIEKALKEDEKPKDLEKFIGFIRDVCVATTESLAKEIQHSKNLEKWANSMFEFQKLLLETGKLHQYPGLNKGLKEN